MRKVTLHSQRFPTWLLLLLSFLFILRIPSFFEPYSYVDEVIYLTLGTGIRQGLILYKDLFDHKTPLIYFIAALADGNQFWFKLIFNAWMLTTVVLFWKLMQKMFTKYPKIVMTSTIIFGILTTLRLFEGMVVESEGLMLGPTILAFYLLYEKNKRVNALKTLLAGVLLSLAAHLKVPAVFDMGAIVLLLLVTDSWKLLLKKYFWLVIGFLIPTLGFSLLFWLQGALKDYVQIAILFNFGYITAFRPDDAQKSFLVKNAPLLMRAALSLIGVVVLFVSRKKFSRAFLFTCLWLITSLFAMTLSERPYPHYVVQILPSISILFGILIASPKYEQVLTVIPLFIAFLVPVLLNTWHYKSVDYYTRFLRFATGQVTKEQYFSEYDKNVNRNYEIARYVRERTSKDDKVFVWGDAPPIYALSKRLPPTKYVTSFHIKDLPDISPIISDLENTPPRFIIITPEAEEFPELAKLISSSYILFHSIEDASIYKRLR
jgi:4-amino-4-deoxy-L-arabinose transferase-like glycosyltransferase